MLGGFGQEVEVTARIGIFGGSFNPVHLGHLVMGQDAMEAYELDEVRFVPCGIPAHKRPEDMASSEHRVAMLEMVAELDEGFYVSRVEVDRPGVSYTIETLDALAAAQPTVEFRFIIGSDTVPELHTWVRYSELLARYPLIVVGRPGADPSLLTAQDLGLSEPERAALLRDVVRGHPMDISASDIRMRIAEGMRIRYLVPEAVEMYIMEHNLYH